MKRECVQFQGTSITATGRVVNSVLPTEQVLRTNYQGPYEGLSGAWPALPTEAQIMGLADAGRFWERNLTNPAEVADPNEYRTELNWVVSGPNQR